MMVQNYHKHTSYSNLFTPFLDSHMSYQAYADRAKELGQKILSSVEHGWQSNHPKVWQCAKANDLKFIFGTEAYYVRDRKEQDNSNGHIIVLAKNRNGFLQINRMLSEANETGFYYVPRVDIELLRELNPQDVWVTSACVSGWGKVNKEDKTVIWHDGVDETMLTLADHFGDSFRLEVQYHNTTWQKMVNEKCLEWSRKYNIPLIAGLDSHYITQDQAQERQYLRESSGIHMNDEDHEFDTEVFEDYPDETTVMNRFMRQGILNASEIRRAMDQSDEILEFDDIDYDTSRKLIEYPKGITQEERNKLFEDRIWESWNHYKESVVPEKYSVYEEGITDEVHTITSTNTSSYFLFDSDMVALGKKKGGIITPTGRGSAGGMFINTLLGLSTLDRFSLPVKLYPERFVTAERLKTSLPDLDLNLSDQKPFTEAQEELLGKGHAYQMVAYGTLKTKAAFKTYARVAGIDADLANEISKQIEEYEKEVANTEDEDEKENIEISDFVDDQYIPLIEKSASYRGVIVSKSPAPCGFLIYDGDIRSEIGLMRVASKQKKTSVMCTAIDGYTADEFGYVKNDELIVSVVGINAEAFMRAGIPQPSSSELIELTKNDKEVWKVFSNGWGQGINQCQRASTIDKLKQYKPNCLQDLSAFVAAIRPGFKSQVKDFCSRKRFKYDIPTIDKILEVNDSAHSSWMLYQENTMTLLNLAGISMADTYPIIKAISKKKVKVIEAAKDQFINGISKYMIEHDNISEESAHDAAHKMWQVIIDSSRYAFNACVSGDTKFYMDNNKYSINFTVEEMYLAMNDLDWAKRTNHLPLRSKYRRLGYPKAYSMYDDYRVRHNKIIDIRPAGFRSLYEITTEHRRKIKVTDNHKFPTPQGIKYTSDLDIGDCLYVCDEYEKDKKKYTLTDGTINNLPHKGQCGFQKHPNGASVVYGRERKKYVENKTPCCLCGREYSDDMRFELHHADCDRHNNDPSNYQWVCVNCHKKIHYSNASRVRKGQKGYPVLTEKIVSIEYVGDEMTYDVEMEAPNHNFVVDSKIITCNSHSVAVSLDALYGAYLKAHYPYEYYLTLLDHYSAKGNKDKIAEIKDEMKIAYNIEIAPPKFREDNRHYSCDKTHHTVSDALPSIKTITAGVAEALYELKDNFYCYFVDLLRDMDKDSRINATKITTLIKCKYFDEFGGNAKLLTLYDMFTNGKTAVKKTLKESTQEVRLQALRDIEDEMDDESLTAEEQVQFETAYYGTPISVYPECRMKYVALETNEKYTPWVRSYSIATGKIGKLKVKKKVYASSPISAGDVFLVESYKKTEAARYNGGARIPIPGVYDIWIEKYKVTRKAK